ncbi:MAG: response regulator [Clostridiales bacterium]
MLKVILIDDKLNSLNKLEELLEENFDVEIVGKFVEANKALEESFMLKPELAFIEIEMDQINGIELAKKMEYFLEGMKIVFISNSDKYALNVFEVHTLDYILRPLNIQKLSRAINRIKNCSNNGRDNLIKDREKIECFGDFKVTTSDRIVLPLSSKVQELLAYLLLNIGSHVEKWSICENIWPMCNPEKAEQNLHTTIYRLKKIIEKYKFDLDINSERGGYRLQYSGYCDFEFFENFIKKSILVSKYNVDKFLDLVDLYKGELFEKMNYNWSSSYSQRYARYFSGISKSVAAYYIKDKNLDGALEVLYKLTNILQYDEEGHEMILEIYIKKEDRASFLKNFENLKELLKKDLGLEPIVSIKKLKDKFIDGKFNDNKC